MSVAPPIAGRLRPLDSAEFGRLGNRLRYLPEGHPDTDAIRRRLAVLRAHARLMAIQREFDCELTVEDIDGLFW